MMTEETNEPQGVDEDIWSRYERASELDRQGHSRASAELVRETLADARRARRATLVIDGLFRLANSCYGTLDITTQREAATELVTLIESEEAVRRIQPDFDEATYLHQKAVYTTCAYDNLAVAVARMKGYNSEAVADVVRCGLEKARESGRLACLVCFREYGVDQSIAADDLDLAERQAEALVQRPAVQGDDDRRTVSARDLGWVRLWRGRPRAAVEAFERALSLRDSYHDADDAARQTYAGIELAALLAGDPSLLSQVEAKHPRPPAVPRGQARDEDCLLDRVAAVRAAIAEKWDEAIDGLAEWMRDADERGDVHLWLRLVGQFAAVHALAGRLDTLREQRGAYEQRAKAARDWFTLRRLARVFDDKGPVDPLGLIADLDEGPWAPPEPSALEGGDDAATGEVAEGATEGADEEVASESGDEGAETPASPAGAPPFSDAIDAWWSALVAADWSEECVAEVEAALLAHGVREISEHDDAVLWLRAASWLLPSVEEAGELWRGARWLGRRFDAQAAPRGAFAICAHLVASRNDAPDDALGSDEIGELFRRSLTERHEDVQLAYDAGRFFFAANELGEAERCFARAARLDRSWASSTMRLGEIYENTDREEDALELYQLAIREGGRHPDLVWRAGMVAFQLERWEQVLALMDLTLEVDAEREWAHYYRAQAAIELGQAELAEAAIDLEANANPELEFARSAVLARAAAMRADEAAARERLEQLLQRGLDEIGPFTPRGTERLFELARLGAEAIDAGELAEKVGDRSLAAGVAPNGYLHARRLARGEEAVPDCSEWEVEFLIENASERPSSAVPPWEQEWEIINSSWVVLAPDEDSAVRLATEMERRAGFEQPRLLQAAALSDPSYRDVPGVVIQRWRRAHEPEEE